MASPSFNWLEIKPTEISREHDAYSYDISPRTWNYDEINLTRHE